MDTLPSNPPADNVNRPESPIGTHASSDSLSGYEIIRRYFLDHYQPAFRRGAAMYSSSRGREVKMGEATAGAPLALLRSLENASDVPRQADTKVKLSALPGFFYTWSKSAWVDILNALPDEDCATVIDGVAADEFRRVVRDAMLTQLVLGREVRGGTQQQRRSLIDWCEAFAKPGNWKPIRSYRCWCRRDELPGGEVVLRVAIQQGLFRQLGADRQLVTMTPTKFARHAAKYGVGRAEGGERPQGQRAVLLTPEFVSELTVAPEPAEQLGKCA